MVIFVLIYHFFLPQGGAMVLGKLPVPGRPTNLDNSGARAYCACSRCGRRLFGFFFLSSITTLFFLPLWDTARYRLKYCIKGPLNPKQPTKPTFSLSLCGGTVRYRLKYCLKGPLSLKQPTNQPLRPCAYFVCNRVVQCAAFGYLVSAGI